MYEKKPKYNERNRGESMSTIYVTTQGAYIRMHGGHLVVTHKDEELSSVPEAAVDAIVLMGYVQISTQAVHELLERGIPVIYCSISGRFRGLLQPSYPKNIYVRLSQYEASLDSSFSTEFARSVAQSKLTAEELTLKRWSRNGWLENLEVMAPLLSIRDQLEGAGTIDQIRGLEAMGAKYYFEALADTLPPPFIWTSRTRQPPRDPINALLSLTYMMAVGEAVSACYATGLDPFIGFLHQLDYGRPSFALDLIEPLRAMCCDHFVMGLLQTEKLNPDNFTTSAEKGCRLLPESFSKYLLLYDSMKNGTAGQRVTLNRLIAGLTRSSVEAISTRTPPRWAELLAGAE